VNHEFINLCERTGIKQFLNALSRSVLASFVLFVDSVLSAAEL
jgi:hypothetical protein